MHARKVSCCALGLYALNGHISVEARLLAHIPRLTSVKRVRRNHWLLSNLAWQYPYHTLPTFSVAHMSTPPILSTCPLYTRYGEKEAHINWFMMIGKGSTHYWNYIEDYWPCAGVLSTVNANRIQLRDPINSGMTRWRVYVSCMYNHHA